MAFASEEGRLHWDFFDKENYELKEAILTRALVRYDDWQSKAAIKLTQATRLSRLRLFVRAECKRERIALPLNYARQALEDLRELWFILSTMPFVSKETNKTIGILNSFGCN
jgi:hypothetical protein